MKTPRKISNSALLAEDLASLPDLSRDDLVEWWRELYRSKPPHGISTKLLVKVIAYRMQEQALGGMTPDTRRFLKKAAENASAGKQVSLTPTIKPGTRLLREWHGVTYEVVVAEEGALFKGKQYRSLSEVARIITGVKWSGPLFFGLKKKGVA